MGDRGNIVLQYENNKHIYLYSHWDGNRLPGVLKNALIRGRKRWDDPAYLSRIIFCEMIKDEPNDLTGYGISPYLTDNEHELIMVNLEECKIYIGDRHWLFEGYVENGPESFDELNKDKR